MRAVRAKQPRSAFALHFLVLGAVAATSGCSDESSSVLPPATTTTQEHCGRFVCATGGQACVGERLTVSWRFQDGISPLTVETLSLEIVGLFASVVDSSTLRLTPSSETSGEFTVQCRTPGRNNPSLKFRASDTTDHAMPFISCDNCSPGSGGAPSM